MKHFPYSLVSLVLLFAVLLSACAPKGAEKLTPTPSSSSVPQPSPAAQLGEWDKILAAARKEGTLMVYNMLGTASNDAFVRGMKQYGINVQAIAGTSGDLVARITVEQRTKAYIADVVTGAWNPTVLEASTMQPVDVALPSLQGNDVWVTNPSQYDQTKSVFLFGTSVNVAITVNTDLVQKGEVQGWQDLLDPKWKGRMVMTDPYPGSGPGASGLGFWVPKLGEDFWRKMATQQISMVLQYSQSVDQLAYGEKAVGLFLTADPLVRAIKAGAPLQIVTPREGNTLSLRSVNVVKDAPHPNAALVFINWLLSKEGQVSVCQAVGLNTIRKDVVEDWISIRELRSGAYPVLEPSPLLIPNNNKNGAAFAKKIFGTK